MKFLTVLFFVSTSLLFLNNCDSTDPKLEPELLLKLEDVSCTEVWLQLKTTNLQLPNNITLFINDLQEKTFNLTTADTLLYIDSLLPNQNYSYQIISFYNPEDGIKSNKVNATTMDTTSHNFTWQTFEFGQHSSSVLYDVAIIDENNIWAVGDIFLNDSLGNPDPKRYNAIKWNGSNWTVIRIPYNYQGADFYNTIQSVFAFSQNDIWFCGNGIIHWNGNNFIPIPIPTNVWGSYQMNKIWGNNSNNLFIVGSQGNIAYYNGNSWIKIESGTTIGLSEIYGNINNEIYVCGGNLNTGQGIILKINGNNTVSKIIDSYYYGTGFDSTKMFKDNLYGPLVGIWVSENSNIYSVGNLIYRFNKIKWDYAKGIEYNYLGAGEFSGRGFLWDVSGTANNDFFFVGQRNTIRHFSGINALQLGEPFTYTSEYSWLSVDYKINLAVTVGRKGGKAAVNIFKR